MRCPNPAHLQFAKRQMASGRARAGRYLALSLSHILYVAATTLVGTDGRGRHNPRGGRRLEGHEAYIEVMGAWFGGYCGVLFLFNFISVSLVYGSFGSFLP